jgi:hypothetical protein
LLLPFGLYLGLFGLLPFGALLWAFWCGKLLEGKRIVVRENAREGLIESLHRELYHRLQKAKLRKNFIHRP